jgi:hypothetical protein
MCLGMKSAEFYGVIFLSVADVFDVISQIFRRVSRTGLAGSGTQAYRRRHTFRVGGRGVPARACQKNVKRMSTLCHMFSVTFNTFI